MSILPNGAKVRFAGLVIFRQRPGTASGVTFMTLEDETGFVNVVLWTRVFRQYAILAKTAAFLGVTGKLEKRDGVAHLIADSLWKPQVELEPERVASRDFHCIWAADVHPEEAAAPGDIIVMMKFTVILAPEADGGVSVVCPALPGCVSEGDSREETLANIREAIVPCLEVRKEQGQPTPTETPELIAEEIGACLKDRAAEGLPLTIETQVVELAAEVAA